ncbi:Gamma-butyrobetaine dioxygenase [Vanrija pseudolonga]|uniref:Gamma-butyrobetaine dioxygenase n=1 Tax=Vanrija pseudolonga TaxID=143232 RepID=A0AAF1BT98_9TREE|nr:Gamma-butyrobetaine dioxygenase [Vanrija pseudolonga]
MTSLVRAAPLRLRPIAPAAVRYASSSSGPSKKPAKVLESKLDSFASSIETPLLTNPVKDHPSPNKAGAQTWVPRPRTPSSPGSSAGGFKGRPAPVLRTNKLAGSFALSESEQREIKSSKPPKPAYNGKGATRKAAPPPTNGGSRPQLRAVQSSARGGSSDPNIRTLLKSPDEGIITVGPGYIQYKGPKNPADLLGGSRPVTMNSIISLPRLRDACPCANCIDPSTRQKNHTSGEAYRLVRALGNEVLDGSKIHMATDDVTQEHGIEVHWPAVGENVAEAHTSYYPLSLIRRISAERLRGTSYLNHKLKRQLWDRETLLANQHNLHTTYAELNGAAPGQPLAAKPEVLLKVLEQLQIYGIAILTGVPTDKTGNKDCELRNVVEQIGLLRNTFYGETWDVKSVPQAKNVAYTNVNLGLHMDLLYFALPPRFQLLHCLRNRVIGGASYFVDSFKAAAAFIEEHPDLAKVLRSNKLEYEYDNDGHYLSYQHHVIPTTPLATGTLHTAVAWSPPFQAPPVRAARDTTFTQPSDPVAATRVENELYEALSKFQEELDKEKYKYEFLLKEGDLVLFDNQRTLHARREFRDRTYDEVQRDGTVIVPGEPTRWLKGAYIDGSTVWDKVVSLNDSVRQGPTA